MDKKMVGLLRDRLDWLNDLTLEKVIIHDDIDGILSMAFLQNYANLQSIVGIYDLECFNLVDEEYRKAENFRKLVGIDLDICLCNIRHIGHHVTPIPAGKGSFNINDHYNIGIRNFYFKYPLNTVILLYALFGLQPRTDKEIALMVYADSVFVNYIKYNENVKKWLIRLGQTNILDALDNRYKEIEDIIINEIVPIIKNIDTAATSDFPQCKLIQKVPIKNETFYYYRGNPKQLLNLIEKFTEWNIIDLPNKLNSKMIYNRRTFKVNEPTDFNKLMNIINENRNDIVSICNTYKKAYMLTVRKNLKDKF